MMRILLAMLAMLAMSLTMVPFIPLVRRVITAPQSRLYVLDLPSVTGKSLTTAIVASTVTSNVASNTLP